MPTIYGMCAALLLSFALGGCGNEIENRCGDIEDRADECNTYFATRCDDYNDDAIDCVADDCVGLATCDEYRDCETRCVGEAYAP